MQPPTDLISSFRQRSGINKGHAHIHVWGWGRQGCCWGPCTSQQVMLLTSGMLNALSTHACSRSVFGSSCLLTFTSSCSCNARLQGYPTFELCLLQDQLCQAARLGENPSGMPELGCMQCRLTTVGAKSACTKKVGPVLPAQGSAFAGLLQEHLLRSSCSQLGPHHIVGILGHTGTRLEVERWKS